MNIPVELYSFVDRYLAEKVMKYKFRGYSHWVSGCMVLTEHGKVPFRPTILLDDVGKCMEALTEELQISYVDAISFAIGPIEYYHTDQIFFKTLNATAEQRAIALLFVLNPGLSLEEILEKIKKKYKVTSLRSKNEKV